MAHSLRIGIIRFFRRVFFFLPFVECIYSHFSWNRYRPFDFIREPAFERRIAIRNGRLFLTYYGCCTHFSILQCVCNCSVYGDYHKIQMTATTRKCIVKYAENVFVRNFVCLCLLFAVLLHLITQFICSCSLCIRFDSSILWRFAAYNSQCFFDEITKIYKKNNLLSLRNEPYEQFNGVNCIASNHKTLQITPANVLFGLGISVLPIYTCSL